MLYLGLILGLIYEITAFICKIIKYKAIRHILDILVVFVGFLAFIVAINLLGGGKFRFFFVIGYLLGFYLERTSIGFLVAKVCLFVYNITIKIFSAMRRKRV